MTIKEALETIEAQGFHFDSESMVDGTFIKQNEYLKDTKEWNIIKQELDELEKIKTMIPNFKFHTEKKSAFVGAETLYENLVTIIELLEEE